MAGSRTGQAAEGARVDLTPKGTPSSSISKKSRSGSLFHFRCTTQYCIRSLAKAPHSATLSAMVVRLYSIVCYIGIGQIQIRGKAIRQVAGSRDTGKNIVYIPVYGISQDSTQSRCVDLRSRRLELSIRCATRHRFMKPFRVRTPATMSLAKNSSA